MSEKILKVKVGENALSVWDDRINSALTHKGDLLMATANAENGEAQLGALNAPSTSDTKILSITNGNITWTDPGSSSGVNNGEFQVNGVTKWSANSAENFNLTVETGDSNGKVKICDINAEVKGLESFSGIASEITGSEKLVTDSGIKVYVDSTISNQIGNITPYTTVADAIVGCIGTKVGDIGEEVTVKAYVDGKETSIKSYADTQDATNLSTAKSYADTTVTAFKNTLGTAAYKGTETSITETDDNLPTSKAVKTYVANRIGKLGTVMQFNGIKNTEAEIKAIAPASQGWVYICREDNSEWVCIENIPTATAIPANWEKFGTTDVQGVAYIGTNTVSDSHIAAYDGITGKLKDGGVIGALSHKDTASGSVTHNKYSLNDTTVGGTTIVSGIGESTTTTNISALTATISYLSVAGLTVSSNGVLSLNVTTSTATPQTVAVTINRYTPSYKYFHSGTESETIIVQ